MKAQLIQAKADIDQGNGLAQTAINSLSGIITGDAYQPYGDVLAELQPGPGGPGLLNALVKQLQALIDQTPDDPPAGN